MLKSWLCYKILEGEETGDEEENNDYNDVYVTLNVDDTIPVTPSTATKPGPVSPLALAAAFLLTTVSIAPVAPSPVAPEAPAPVSPVNPVANQ